MKKVLICGLRKDHKGILEFLQRQGALEINNMLQEDDMLGRTDMTFSKIVFEQSANTAGQVINILGRYALEEKGMLSSFEGREVLSLNEYEANANRHNEVMERVYHLQEPAKQIDKHSAAALKLEQQMEALMSWRSLDLPFDFRGTKKTVALIGPIQDGITLEQVTEQLGELAPQAEIINVTIVGVSEEQTCPFIVYAKTDAEAVEDALEKMNSARPPLSSAVPTRRQQQLEEEPTKERAKIEKAEKAVAEMALDRELIESVVDYYTTRIEKYGVLSGLVQPRRAFFVTGYVPENTVPKLEKSPQEKYEVVVEYAEPGDEEDTPILLHNSEFAESVEGVTKSYSVPSKGETDLSTIVALSHYIQFGFMLPDVICDLITVADTAYCLTKFKSMEAGVKKFMRTFTCCDISATLQGFMFGSFFGDVVNAIATTSFNWPDIRLALPWFGSVSFPMRLSVFVFRLGILHPSIEPGIKFYSYTRNGSLADGIYDTILWYILVGGGVVYLLTMSMFTEMPGFISMLPVAAGTVATYTIAVGFVGIVFINGRESKSWVKRVLKGLYGAYGFSSYLSDILSYSRFLILGLATSVISTVFNEMGSMAGDSIPGAIIFILILLIGHSLNLVINALGVYVRTNRL